MELYIMRHAMAAEQGKLAGDIDRSLSDQGRQQLQRSMRNWEGLGVQVDGILTSPYARAMQTAKIVAEALGIPDRIEACTGLASGASPATIIDALKDQCHDEHRVLIVGHEPDLGRLISTLVCGNDEAEFRIKKAGLTKLVVDELHEGRCAVLEWHLWPRHLVRMG